MKKTFKSPGKKTCFPDNTISKCPVGENCVLLNPIKSDSDQKDYKVIQLPNGLTACLISDKNLINSEEIDSESGSESSDISSISSISESEEENDSTMSDIEQEDDEGSSKKHRNTTEQKMSAAGLCIGVGSFSDPKEVPGMAHFLEHMVFMGSKKYPKENDFDEFITQNGGSDNASTDVETTVFYFECLEKNFREALDKFSQFFISPLMKRGAMTREREAIESEFQIALPSDSARKEQLLGSLAKNGSPINSFLWGNLITLRDNISDKDLYNGVHKFRERHYSAHRMTLAIQARLPLEELEKFVSTYFSNIPNNKLPPDNFSEIHKDIFNTPEFNKIYYVSPVKDFCQLHITWALPSLKNQYKSKPHHFISYLLGDEGKTSLFSYLKKNLWVLGTTTGNDETGTENNSLYTLFTVQLNLTEDGYKNIPQVVESVFSYIKMLKKIGPQQRVFDEIQAISNMAFKYLKEETAVDIVEDMCEAMQFYPPEHYITGSELYFEYDPKTIELLLDNMSPEKANYIIFKKPFEREIVLDRTEKWFGTQYTYRDIPVEWINQWKNAKVNDDLFIPPPNSFITNDFSILPDLENNPNYPLKVFDNTLTELWYRRDLKFKLPYAYYYMYLISPLATQDAKHSCMLDTLVNLLSIDISEDIYPATSANLFHSFIAYENGLIIKVWGFNEKLPILINLISKHLINLADNITSKMFVTIKDKLLKHYYNKLLKPTDVSKDLRLNLLVDHHFNTIEKYTAMSNISFEDIKDYINRFQKSLYLKSLVQGNVDQVTAYEVTQAFIKSVNFTELKKEDIPKFTVMKLNNGEKCCRIQNFNKGDKNSIITNYYQSDKITNEKSVIVDLIMMVIEEPLFNMLRTKEQLGYSVYCSARDTFGVLGYTITVNTQASKNSTQYVDERIENFLKYTKELLNDLNEVKFEKVKENTIKMKQCIDVHLKEEVDRNWSEIVSGDYIFNRINEEIEAIRKTDLKTVRSWWESHNSFGKKENFKKLSIQVVGFKDATDTSENKNMQFEFLGSDSALNEKQDKAYFIKDIKEHKNLLSPLNVK